MNSQDPSLNRLRITWNIAGGKAEWLDMPPPFTTPTTTDAAWTTFVNETYEAASCVCLTLTRDEEVPLWAPFIAWWGCK
ncbi:unnamed protein product [Colias eurytheme]|nr:unnamed protein product [Colias eurytheme]